MQRTNEEPVCQVPRYTPRTAGLIHQTHTYLFWECKNITLNAWEGHLLIWSQTNSIVYSVCCVSKNKCWDRFILSTNFINKAENVEMWKHGLNIVHNLNNWMLSYRQSAEHHTLITTPTGGENIDSPLTLPGRCFLVNFACLEKRKHAEKILWDGMLHQQGEEPRTIFLKKKKKKLF